MESFKESWLSSHLHSSINDFAEDTFVQQLLGLKKKLFVSCNPTLTSFYQKNPYPKVFSALIKHSFLTKEIMQKKCFYRPTYPYFFPTVTELGGQAVVTHPNIINGIGKII